MHNRRTKKTDALRRQCHLVCFDHVKEWDHGYIEVMTRFSHTEELIEEYIDLVPILSNLYIDPDKFLETIERRKNG